MLVVLLLLWLASACAYPHTFIGGNYTSSGHTHAYQFQDLALGGSLETLVSKRAFRGELIVFSFTATGYWLDWAVNMAHQLQAVGYDHYVALSYETDCEAFSRRVERGACATYTLPGAHWDVLKHSIDYLWTMRYHVSTLLAERSLNIMVLDLDCIIRRDVYVDLKSAPLRDVQLIHMEEGFANGGLFYIQNALRNGPALWTHAEVFRRADAIALVRHRDGAHLGTAMDQAMVNDAINAAGSPSGSAYDWPSTYVTGDGAHGHAFWAEHDRGKRSKRIDGQLWYGSAWTSSEQRYSVPAQLPDMAPAEAWAGFKANRLSGVQLKYITLQIPTDALDERGQPLFNDVRETFAAAPHWTFANTEFERFNWPVAAVTHLVAASADWGDERQWTHAGRRALMAAAGAWHNTRTVAGQHRAVASLSSRVLEKHLTANSSKQEVAALVQRLFAAAAELERMPAMFAVPCTLPWIERHQWSRVASDWRIVVHGAKCYPAPGGQDCWHDAFIYEFEVTGGHVPQRTRTSFDDARAMHEVGHVRLNHLPTDTATGTDTPRYQNLRQKCHKFFL
jgi:hypothetical protein